MAEAPTSEPQSSPAVTAHKNQFISASGEFFTVSNSIFKHSGLLSTMKNVLDSESDGEAFPLPHVSSDCLRRIINFVEFNSTLTLNEIQMKRDATSYAGDLLTLPVSELRELLHAVNYMDMPVLLNVVSRTLGERFRDTPLETAAEMVDFEKPDDNAVRREYLNDLIVHFIPQTELCMGVLDFAEVWNSIDIRTNAAFQKDYCTELYLRITVPSISMSKGPRKLDISVDSHDQGWSSYPHNAGTRDNSWTWGEIWVSNNEGKTLCSYTVYRNIHASSNWELQHKTFDRYDELMTHIKPGLNLDLMLRAEYPGWVNHTRFAEMKFYFV